MPIKEINFKKKQWQKLKIVNNKKLLKNLNLQNEILVKFNVSRIN